MTYELLHGSRDLCREHCTRQPRASSWPGQCTIATNHITMRGIGGRPRPLTARARGGSDRREVRRERAQGRLAVGDLLDVPDLVVLPDPLLEVLHHPSRVQRLHAVAVEGR
ncbi:hypothetical protein BDA96_10G294100 [Sorghum bicolor]|uniref:Uncharacterized protein n=2 Tax=Sorghum bicolor TaxID=4558 RepID=A0A921U2H4_SORBI|nr:hypothetical protein BDA96_10G294100 [Sorghum bicolor]